jgi:hypothetical protein
MGKLNIAHHKSYHPYRRDNIERVKRDEEEARLKEMKEEGRLMLAVRVPALFNLTTANRDADCLPRMLRPAYLCSANALAYMRRNHEKRKRN